MRCLRPPFRMVALGLMMLLTIGCQTSQSSGPGGSVDGKALTVYVTSAAQTVREKALSYGLSVKTLDENSPSTELIQALLNSPSKHFFAVINPNRQRYITGGAIPDKLEPAELDALFRGIAQMSKAGTEQMGRLEPSAKGQARLVIFSDFQCPFCQMVDGLLPQWQTRFGDKLEVEFVHFPLPMHQNAFAAAEAAECARVQGKFDPYREGLFANQKTLNEGLFYTLARQNGLERKAFQQCLTLHQQRKKVRQDQYFAQYMGISGTPTLVLNGELLNGTNPDQIPEKIQAALTASPAKTAAIPPEAAPGNTHE